MLMVHLWLVSMFLQPVQGPRASRARAAAAPGRVRAAGGYRRLVIQPGPRAGAGQNHPHEMLAGAREAAGSGPLGGAVAEASATAAAAAPARTAGSGYRRAAP